MMVVNSIYALQKDSRGISEMGFPVYSVHKKC